MNADEARLLLALELYETRQLSSGKAAEFAGVSQREFLESLGRYQIPTFGQAAD